MPYPFVKCAVIQNGAIQLTVELDYPDSGSYVEVSGSATQSGGAYANFYDIQEATSGLTDPSGPHPTVTVSAHPLPPNNFKVDEDVTTVVRVSKVWLTVLGPGAGPYGPYTDGNKPPDGTTWDKLKEFSHVTDGFTDDSHGDGSPPGAPQTPPGS